MTATLKAPIRRLPRYPAYKDSGVEWLGEIPSSWNVTPLFTAARERFVPNVGGYEDAVLSLSYGRVIPRNISDNFGLMPESFETYQIIEPNNIVLRLTDLQNDKRSLRVGLATDKGIITSAYVVLAVTGQLVPKYAAYLLHAYDVTKVFYSLGGGVRQTMKYEDLKWLPMVLPSTSEQRGIAAFLDRETARIDALVAKKERLIELLQEKRIALITRAVTKGLDPTVPMKDCGVEWLGEIPAHWEVEENRWLFRESEIRSTLGDEELMTVSHITGVTRRSEKPDVTMIEAESHEDYKVCHTGELTINTMWAWMGALGIAFEPGIVSPSYNVYRIESKSLVPRYYDYLCRIPLHLTEIIRNSKGIWRSRLRLYPDAFREIVTPIPPPSEQDAIAGFLDRETARIEDFVAKVREAIERLKELRVALISAAVTGKIDVRDEVAV